MRKVHRLSDGAYAPLWFFRICTVLVFPFFISWVFFSTLIREIGRAFRFAYLDVRGEFSMIRKYWNGGVFRD